MTGDRSRPFWWHIVMALIGLLIGWVIVAFAYAATS